MAWTNPPCGDALRLESMNARIALLPAIALAVGLIVASTSRGAGIGAAGGAGNAGSRGDSNGSSTSSSSSSVGSVSIGGGGGGGAFSPSSGGSVSIPHSSGGFVSPGSSAPTGGGSNFSRGSVPSAPVNPPTAVGRPSVATRVEPPAGVRSGSVINRPFSVPGQPGVGISSVPRTGISAVPQPAGAARNRIENFVGIRSGISTIPAGSTTTAPLSVGSVQKVTGSPPRPDLRSDWAVRSLNRSPQWQQRVANRNNAWNDWQQKNQGRLDSFEKTRDQRWAALQINPQNQSPARLQSRAGWPQQREARWNFRADRANEIRSHVRDFCDGFFDDRWWGRCPWAFGFGFNGFGHFPRNPWWWWSRANWAGVSSFVAGCPGVPFYSDYGQNVVYDGDNVYVDGQPTPAAQYTEPMTDLAVNAAQPPPPTPPVEGQPAEWMPLGVFALAQEEKGDPLLFLQLSVSRQGAISGAYTSALTEDQRPVAGVVDRASERVVFRIGANTDTIFETTLANLTQDVSPVAVHFGNSRTQTWLLVRMPEPAPEGKTEEISDVSPEPPPLNPPAASTP